MSSIRTYKVSAIDTMRGKTVSFYLVLGLMWATVAVAQAPARDITFCGEKIPIDNKFVANKLMNVIRQQIPDANLPDLRRRAKEWFPYIEYCLRLAGMPEDLKYIPIVESGFRNVTSPVGAQGYWQFMPRTAKAIGLQVNKGIDERNNPRKATIAALLHLANNYKYLRQKYNISSWVLTVAAYNCGSGCIGKKIKSQGTNDYFTMRLNAETALYVYKIIAIKELFEYPEQYMKNFTYNVFKEIKPSESENPQSLAEFENVEVQVPEGKNITLEASKIENIPEPSKSDLEPKKDKPIKKGVKLVIAEVIGKYHNFKDGDPVRIRLEEDLKTLSGLRREGTLVIGKGWIIEDRVHIDLGFNTNNVILYDSDSEQGIALSSLKKKRQAQVILKVQN